MLEPKPPPPDRSGERIRGKYKLDSRIAVGGMGEVYRATNTLVGREVAIKILLPHLARSENVRARFLREAQLAHFVRHTHVVEIFDIDEDEGGIPFIVQELLEGEDLASYLDRAGGALPLDVTFAVMVPVAEALGAAHVKGLVHRDLKPENIYLSDANSVLIPKILDFGISKVTKSGVLTSEADGRTIVGSPAYMSPEQIRTPAEVDQRTDVWAVGVILYECLTGRSPFHAASVPDLFVKICRDDPPPIERFVSDLPPSLRDLVMGCLDRRPDHRPHDGAALARELHRIPLHSGSASPSASRREHSPPRIRANGPPSERPMQHQQVERTAPDLSEYGVFQVPDELLLDFGDLGALDSPASIASAVAQVTAGRRSAVGGAPRDKTPSRMGEPNALEMAPLDIDPRDLPARQGRRSYAGTPANSPRAQPPATSAVQRRAERVATESRPREVPTLGVTLSAGAWLGLAAASVAVFGRSTLPSALTDIGAALGFVVLGLVLALGATTVGMVVRSWSSSRYSLSVVALGGVGVTFAAGALGLRHVMPNLPLIRDNHAFIGLVGAGSVALLALGLGLRGLVMGADSFRIRPRRAGLGVAVLAASVALIGGAVLAFYALGSGKLSSLESHSPSFGAGPRLPASE